MAVTAYEVTYALIILAIITLVISIIFGRKAEVVVVETPETPEEQMAWAAAMRLAKAAPTQSFVPAVDPVVLAKEVLEEIAVESIRRHFLSEEERDEERLARGARRRQELGL